MTVRSDVSAPPISTRCLHPPRGLPADAHVAVPGSKRSAVAPRWARSGSPSTASAYQPATWHFHFHGEIPERLVAGRERTYLEHFWNDFAADPAHSISEADREFYAAAYARGGGIHATMQYFSEFPRDAADNAALAANRLPMPTLVLTGEKASGDFLVEQARLVAKDVTGVVVPGAGHWLMEEAPEQVIPRLAAFLSGA